MHFESLKHWTHIRELSLTEAASLIAGIDPTAAALSGTDKSRVIVYERAIAEAVQRANELAWHDARELDQLLWYSAENSDEIKLHKMLTDIWECSDRFQDYLPSLEIRNSVGAVHEDPENVPILLPIDPWYTATVYAGDLNDWIERSEIESAFLFADEQRVVVTSRENNWHSQDAAAPPGSDTPHVEGVRAFNEKAGPAEKSLATRERNVLLAIVAALCREAKIDFLRHAKAAGLIKDLTVSLGLNVGESTIEAHLKRIPEALESRAK